MKALILAAGKGKRLNGVLGGMNKCMTEVSGKPIIEWVLGNIARTEKISEVVIVVGYKAEDIISRIGSNYMNLNIKYVVQKEQKGVVNAIECAKDEIGLEDFLLLLGDEFMISPRHVEMINHFYRKEYFSLLGSVIVDNKEHIKKTYTFEFNSNGEVTHLVEKPENPLNNYMGTGNIFFNHSIFDYIQSTPINPVRGEKELVDLIRTAINDKRKVGYFQISSFYLNLNTIEEFTEIKCMNL
mgnify:CR=1 FL=1